MNVVMFIFVPFVVYFQHPGLNRGLLHYAYFSVLLIGVFLYTTFAIILTPVAYVIILVKLTRNLIGIRSRARSKLITAIDLLVFLFFGLFIILIQSFIDIFYWT